MVGNVVLTRKLLMDGVPMVSFSAGLVKMETGMRRDEIPGGLVFGGLSVLMIAAGGLIIWRERNIRTGPTRTTPGAPPGR